MWHVKLWKRCAHKEILKQFIISRWLWKMMQKVDELKTDEIDSKQASVLSNILNLSSSVQIKILCPVSWSWRALLSKGYRFLRPLLSTGYNSISRESWTALKSTPSLQYMCKCTLEQGYSSRVLLEHRKETGH